MSKQPNPTRRRQQRKPNGVIQIIRPDGPPLSSEELRAWEGLPPGGYRYERGPDGTLRQVEPPPDAGSDDAQP